MSGWVPINNDKRGVTLMFTCRSCFSSIVVVDCDEDHVNCHHCAAKYQTIVTILKEVDDDRNGH